MHNGDRHPPTHRPIFTGWNTANVCAVLSYQPFARSSCIKMSSARRKISAYSFSLHPKYARLNLDPGMGDDKAFHVVNLKLYPRRRTSSLNKSRIGSTNSKAKSSGKPPTLWCDLITCVLPFFCCSRFDHVWVNRTLCKEIYAIKFTCFFSKYFMNSRPIILRFFSGSTSPANAVKKRCSASARITDTHVFREHIHYLLTFV